MAWLKKLLRKPISENLPVSDLAGADEGSKCGSHLAPSIPTQERMRFPKRSRPEIAAPLPKSVVSALTVNIEPPVRECLESGLACYRDGDYGQAIVSSTRAIELAPGVAAAYIVRGIAYQKAGDLQQALEDLNKAIELDSHFAVAYYNRGIVSMEAGDLEQAVRDFDRVVELDPSFAVAYINRGIAHRILGKPEQAIQDYTNAIEIAPQYADAYSNRGFAYAGSGDLQKAIQDFSKAIELDPEHDLAYRHRGRAYHESGVLEEALQDLNRAVELCPDDATAYTCRGLAYRDFGNADMAYRDFLAAARIDPGDVDFTLLRLAYASSSVYDPYGVKEDLVRARRELGEIAEGDATYRAISAANKVLEKNYLLLSAHMRAALAYKQAGDEEKAAYHQTFGGSLVQSILQSGDGSSFRSAFVVVSLDEQYAMLPVLGAVRGGQQLQLQRQRLSSHEGHMFDVFEVSDMKTGGNSEVYFNIDLIVKAVQEGRVEMPSARQP